MSTQTILIICYITLALMVLLSLKHSSLARPFKLGLVVITSMFYINYRIDLGLPCILPVSCFL